MTHTLQPPAPDTAPDPAGADEVPYLWTRLRLVEERVRLAVALRRAVDPDLDDPYRGQYFTPEGVAQILDEEHGPGLPALAPGGPPPGSPLDVLATRFGLDPLDVDLLLVALAPDLDARFERLYGYLNDDLTRRRPTVGLALELCGRSRVAAARFRLSPAHRSSRAVCWRSRRPNGRPCPGCWPSRTGSPPTCSATPRPIRVWPRCSARPPTTRPSTPTN